MKKKIEVEHATLDTEHSAEHSTITKLFHHFELLELEIVLKIWIH